eukprot:7644881-Pyramimonas_sp.AAC.1
MPTPHPLLYAAAYPLLDTLYSLFLVPCCLLSDPPPYLQHVAGCLKAHTYVKIKRKLNISSGSDNQVIQKNMSVPGRACALPT